MIGIPVRSGVTKNSESQRELISQNARVPWTREW